MEELKFNSLQDYNYSQYALQLLEYFKPSEPWKRMHTTPKAVNRKPSEFTSEQLENEYFQLFLNARKSRYAFATCVETYWLYVD